MKSWIFLAICFFPLLADGTLWSNYSCAELVPLTSTLFQHDNEESSTLLYATTTSIKGVAVVAHGLNLRPSKMDLIAQILRENGYHVVRVTLAGHNGDLEQMRRVDREKWLQEAYMHYCEAKRIQAQYGGKKSLLVGFSLGALVFESLMNEAAKSEINFDQAILFAPALAVRATSRLMVTLTTLMPSTMIIPSMSPKAYQANRGTSLAAYRALFQLQEMLDQKNWKRNNIKTLIFVDPDDELVDVRELKKKMEQMTKWSMEMVSAKDSELEKRYHHLIIDQQAVGEQEWNRIKGRLLDVL